MVLYLYFVNLTVLKYSIRRPWLHSLKLEINFRRRKNDNYFSNRSIVQANLHNLLTMSSCVTAHFRYTKSYWLSKSWQEVRILEWTCEEKFLQWRIFIQISFKIYHEIAWQSYPNATGINRNKNSRRKSEIGWLTGLQKRVENVTRKFYKVANMKHRNF
jgi:hypothetical protein